MNGPKISIGGAGPCGPKENDKWLDTTNVEKPVLRVFDGYEWQIAKDQPVLETRIYGGGKLTTPDYRRNESAE